ncbi:50S ribosomal protein L4 [Candidatus Saccharibacteria bacterium]|nr:50S ribosomal protein L4 [Candidatus Saccharibacteria bacterium]
MATTATSYSKTGAKHDTAIKLDAGIFGAEANHDLVQQAYNMYLSNGRVAKASTLKRGEVAGGGKKPWKQKGTGRARVGSIRVPNWRGGGVVFGPTGNENYTVAMNIKAKRAAIRQALSLRAEAGDIIILETFEAAEGRVKPTIELFGKMNISGSVLMAVEAKTSLVDRATRNVAGLKTVSATYLNVFEVMNADKIIITEKALDVIKEWLGATK